MQTPYSKLDILLVLYAPFSLVKRDARRAIQVVVVWGIFSDMQGRRDVVVRQKSPARVPDYVFSIRPRI